MLLLRLLIIDRVSGDVAQLVEQRTENPCVGGSIPSITTNTERETERERGNFVFLFLFLFLCQYQHYQVQNLNFGRYCLAHSNTGNPYLYP